MMKVLITGGAGYIGTELVKALNKVSGISEIIVYDNLWKDNYNLFTHSNIKNGKVKFIRAEILDSRQLKKTLKDVDIVYHLAAHVDSKLINANHHLYEQINNWGTAELTYAIEESSVKKVINASSIAVYGNASQTIDSVENPNPKTYYGTSKLRGEEHMIRLQEKINVYNLRIGNVYGYGTSMRMDTFINQFVFGAAFENRIKILGEGEQKRGLIQINNLIDILVGIIDTDLKPDTYNVVENSYSILEIADVLKSIIPEMEMLFVNQHLQLRNIDIAPNKEINRLIKTKRTSIKKEFEIFLNHLYLSE